ncbi:MAG: Ldh family oxidoreductase, partial [Acidimicrobiia bacterium]|nr:Ldh family oxidoreductase [Acidimicrobiia bacterium]
MHNLTLDEVERLSRRMLITAGATELQAEPTARSIRDAEADGIRAVGLNYLPTYCDHVACGKVDGEAVPEVMTPRAAVIEVDARNGFCHPAYEAAAEPLRAAAVECGIAMLTIRHSYSAGVLGWFVESLAVHGLVALMVSNTSPSVAAHGGRLPFFGTNPLAWATPRAGGSPVVADMSSSAAAYVSIMAAASKGRAIPEGWALDTDGNPTTD